MPFQPTNQAPQGATTTDLLELILEMRHDLMRVETRLCKLMEHVGAAHLLNNKAKELK